MRTRFIGFFLLLTLCSVPFSAAIADVGDTSDNPLVIAFQGGAVTLDPIMRSENTAYSWQRHIFDTVTLRNREGKVVPRIATAWKTCRPSNGS